jgi:hypothetical protein
MKSSVTDLGDLEQPLSATIAAELDRLKDAFVPVATKKSTLVLPSGLLPVLCTVFTSVTSALAR